MAKTLVYTIIFCVVVLSIGIVVAEDASSPVRALKRAHAHNDYEHSRPLFDALDQGFCSVEADIFLVNDTLLVAHYANQAKPERTLESLYMEPLRERAKKFEGKILPGANTFYLWIDLKTDATSTYPVLRKLLEKYADILTRYENNKIIPGAVTVILTGSASVNLIRNEPVRYAGVDGGRTSLNSDESSDMIPAIGLSWRSEFPRFTGSLTPDEREKLTEQIRKVHEKGRKVRYWGTPDNEAFWSIMYDAEADFINTNRLQPLRHFLSERD